MIRWDCKRHFVNNERKQFGWGGWEEGRSRKEGFFSVLSLIAPCVNACKSRDIHMTQCWGFIVSLFLSLWHEFDDGGWLRSDSGRVDSAEAMCFPTCLAAGLGSPPVRPCGRSGRGRPACPPGCGRAAEPCASGSI